VSLRTNKREQRVKHSVSRTPPLTKSTTHGTYEAGMLKRVPALFYRTEAGSEPVRAWLKEMTPDDRRLIGEDIKTVEFGWPLGMPLCRPMGDGLHEIRTHLSGNRIARVFFYVDNRQRLVLLHGILKKSRATPAADLELARQNKRKHERGLK
jgi:phage-related protein